MKAYLRAFMNWEPNNYARLLLVIEFTYNNAKNTSTNHNNFELNWVYYPRITFKYKTNTCTKSCSANKLANELIKKLIEICYQNLFYT